MNNRDPFAYRTTDYGQTWKMIVTGIPKSMLSYAKVIYEDPLRRGMLYLGTENAIYVSFDAGDNWQPLQNDLPHAPVSGIVVQEHRRHQKDRKHKGQHCAKPLPPTDVDQHEQDR